jgi:hypothetical protein
MLTHLFESNRIECWSNFAEKQDIVAVSKMEKSNTCTFNYNLQCDRDLLCDRNGIKQNVRNKFVFCNLTEHDRSLKDEYFEAPGNFSKDVRLRHAHCACGAGPRSSGTCATFYA